VIVCRTLGPVAVSVDGGSAPPELLWRKNLALLVYLARSPKRARAREHLIGLLWGDKPEGAARHSLNEAVRVLRRHAGEGGVETEAGQVRLVAGAVELDTDRLDTLLAAKDYRSAVALVAGEFLEGFAVSGASAFEDWMTAERALWRGRSVDALLRRADELLGTGDLPGAHEMAQRALVLDPTSDVAVRAVMRCRALAGDRAGALECYETFAARLAGEVDTEPDTDTKALAERVRRERAWRLPAVAAGAGAGEAAAESRRAPLVGRASELARLLGAWTACRRDRRAAVAIVEGDAGTGKTRLAEELLGRARLDGAAVAAVRAVEADRAARGAYGSALATTDGLVGLAAPETDDPFFRTVLHLSRAGWYERVGQLGNAQAELMWHENSDLFGYPTGDPQPAEVDWAFGPLAEWRRGALLDRAGGRRKDACRAYRTVARLWGTGEPRYRARADSAARRLAALGCGVTA